MVQEHERVGLRMDSWACFIQMHYRGRKQPQGATVDLEVNYSESWTRKRLKPSAEIASSVATCHRPPITVGHTIFTSTCHFVTNWSWGRQASPRRAQPNCIRNARSISASSCTAVPLPSEKHSLAHQCLWSRQPGSAPHFPGRASFGDYSEDRRRRNRPSIRWVERHLHCGRTLRGRPRQDRARWRAPSSPRRCSESTLPGRCASGWATSGRCARCAAGRVKAR